MGANLSRSIKKKSLPTPRPITNDEKANREIYLNRLIEEYRTTYKWVEAVKEDNKRLEAQRETLQRHVDDGKKETENEIYASQIKLHELINEKERDFEKLRNETDQEERRLTNENKEFDGQLAVRKRVSDEWDESWSPLNELILKFNEFDVDKSGYITRDEFRRLCVIIENETHIARLHSDSIQQHSASSVYQNNKMGTGHNQGSIDSAQAWSAASNNHQQWYQIDAILKIWVAGLLIQGRHNADQWVKKLKVSYSHDGVTWTSLSVKDTTTKAVLGERIFEANQDRDSQNRIIFDEPIYARYVRVHPTVWHGHISLRLDLLWVEDYGNNNNNNKHEDIGGAEDAHQQQSESEFSFAEMDVLFDTFDLKKTGGIDLSEFIAVVDREAIRNPRDHPHSVIKEAMRYLLRGGRDAVEEVYDIDMLGKESLNIIRGEGDGDREGVPAQVCVVCYFEPGTFGFPGNCKHSLCAECLKPSLEYAMNGGRFPLYCPGCQAENTDNHGSYITGALLRAWVEHEVIELKMAVRLFRLQQKSLQRK